VKNRKRSHQGRAVEESWQEYGSADMLVQVVFGTCTVLFLLDSQQKIKITVVLQGFLN